MTESILGIEYQAGEVICSQGEAGDRMYVLQSGRAQVLRSEAGRDVVIGELQAGDIFGEMSIFDRSPRSATVRAEGRATVMTLDKKAFLRRVHEDPSLAFHVLKKMSERVRKLDEELSALREITGEAA